MFPRWFVHITAVCVSLIAAFPAMSVTPALAKRNLTVQLRQVEEGDNSGYVIGTKAREALMTEQIVNVRNGEKAVFNIFKAMPLQWVQSVAAQSATLSASGALANSVGGEVSNAVVWMQAGQSIEVRPHWPGGKHRASVEIDVQSANVSQRSGTKLPDQSHSRLKTSLSLPMGQWVTIASSGSGSGSGPQSGVYSSQAASSIRRLLQMRVTVP